MKIDDRKPFLVKGADLVAFIKTRQKQHKKKCEQTEMYCCKCHLPRKPLSGTVELIFINKRQIQLQAFCSICKTKIFKFIKPAKLEEYKKIFMVNKRQY
ncbi:MAG: hypothetical protein P9M03_01065 [Candidatus Theseobacter exili]|nr:hypothetical protein [Candidatus Theseobacter exili]